MKITDDYINIAIENAKKSTCTFRHGAILINTKNKIIKSAFNHRRQIFTHFKKDAIHAEMAVLKNVNTKILKNYTLIVIRISSDYKLVNSKPCHNCESVLKNCRGLKVFYSNDKGYIIKL